MPKISKERFFIPTIGLPGLSLIRECVDDDETRRDLPDIPGWSRRCCHGALRLLGKKAIELGFQWISTSSKRRRLPWSSSIKKSPDGLLIKQVREMLKVVTDLVFFRRFV